MAEASDTHSGRLVIKVGGSLAETGELSEVLARIAEARRPVIVVPGGGSFADKVRDLQNALRFDDASAHRLAILGMHQMAEVFLKLERRLAPADSLEGIARVLTAGLIPVWLPLPMVQDDETIPRDWSITSDGLAARLAERLGAAVVLVKSCEIDPKASAESLAAEGIVDPVFPQIAGRANLKWLVLGPDDEPVLKALLEGRDIGWTAANLSSIS